eukprot:scaffold3242_cov351-Prasinococcus_capsulatus_cf.AAC.6
MRCRAVGEFYSRRRSRRGPSGGAASALGLLQRGDYSRADSGRVACVARAPSRRLLAALLAREGGKGGSEPASSMVPIVAQATVVS